MLLVHEVGLEFESQLLIFVLFLYLLFKNFTRAIYLDSQLFFYHVKPVVKHVLYCIPVYA